MTHAQGNFSLLRRLLRALGLSAEAIDDIIDRIIDFLSEPKEKDAQAEYPYSLSGDLLTPAERSFFLILRSTVSDRALICPKVGLGDLFSVKAEDPSTFRIYRNKIDRKHIDFLLCDSQTARPLLGIELDDKSHQQRERQDRDEFVQRVFSAAQLPLIHVPVKHSYSVSALSDLLRPYLEPNAAPPSSMPSADPAASPTPLCPKCGSTMVLRTARTGANKGGQFWGCSKFPGCRAVLKYETSAKEAGKV